MTHRAKTIGVAILAAVALRVSGNAGPDDEIVVDQSGKGTFRTIQEAINAVPAGHSGDVTIFIRNGLYQEKLFIQKSHIRIVGEDRDSTRIVFAVLRETWNRDHDGSDWGSGVVNIDTGVSDILLANLTVYNNEGWKEGVFNKHEFAIRGAGTRIILLRCNVISDGGDALSLWNKQNGMYYHADCSFEGWVDYVCPRGWCYITNSRFFGHNLSASIWHDGDADRSQKFVIRSSRFDGVPGFPLGRNHRDGQIYLLDCTFSDRMADKPIYHPPSSKTAWQWGDRHYYYDCHRDGGDFSWFRDNLDRAEGSPKPEQVTARWTFEGRWDPESSMPSVLPVACIPKPDNGGKGADPGSVRLSWVPGRQVVAHVLSFGDINPPPRKAVLNSREFLPGQLKPRTTYFWRVDEVTETDTVKGDLWSFTTAGTTR